MTPAELRKLIEANHESGENGSDAWHELAEALVRHAPRILALMEAAEKWLDVDDESVPTEVRHANLRAAVRDLREG